MTAAGARVGGRASGTLFCNTVFDERGAEGGVSAELQATRLRLEAAESERAALAAELSTVQGRLCDALEVLEGVLAERSALKRQAQEVQAQLAAALQERRGGGGADAAAAPSEPADASLEAGASGAGTPPRALRQELLLAQAQLSELRQAQRTWELERQQLLSEVEEERQRLQDGLSQALSQASCARREADAAAERATHWCTLAELLQRSALLSGSSPASPASLGSLGGASPAAGSASKPPPSMLRSASRGCGLGSAASTGTHLAPGGGDWCSPASVPQLRRRPTTADRYTGVGAGADSLSASEDGPGLIAAFQAVAGAAAGSPGNAQALGSPVPNLCPSSAAVGGSEAAAAAAAARDVDEGHCAASGGVVGLAASADLAPGSHLSLLKRLPAPGLSASLASSSGEGSMPLTPALCAAAPGVSQDPATPATAISGPLPSPLCAAHAKSGFFSRLLCASRAPATLE